MWNFFSVLSNLYEPFRFSLFLKPIKLGNFSRLMKLNMGFIFSGFLQFGWISAF